MNRPSLQTESFEKSSAINFRHPLKSVHMQMLIVSKIFLKQFHTKESVGLSGSMILDDFLSDYTVYIISLI